MLDGEALDGLAGYLTLMTICTVRGEAEGQATTVGVDEVCKRGMAFDRYVPWKERRAGPTALRSIYGAATLTDAEQELEHFAERWDTK